MRVTVLAATLLTCTLIFMSAPNKAEAEAGISLSNGIEIALLDSGSSVPFMTEEVVSVSAKQEANEVVRHTVKKGETLSKIAKIYQTSWQRLYDKNTELQDPDIINPDDILVIPSPEEELEARPLPERKDSPIAASPATKSANAISPVGGNAGSAGNGYVAGYCTWYVKNRRPDLPNNLGNASTWVSRAAAQGLPTGTTPLAGAVGQRGNHVVYVEKVNDDGTITITDMNYQSLYVITTRTVPASQFSYIY